MFDELFTTSSLNSIISFALKKETKVQDWKLPLKNIFVL
ncbi:hypothetical protein SAMN05421664_0096 [Chryseobacterium soldanellicola]|uniref:Uncharacterized protein n=1 Tax=Chryseobacterium soldanellicola TaxID=311333 RepID=A0A1H0XNC2_9FLAO|nr:hypothetical protein SAMN05421664_0096 [Chryseobacterium soldanellicola]